MYDIVTSRCLSGGNNFLTTVIFNEFTEHRLSVFRMNSGRMIAVEDDIGLICFSKENIYHYKMILSDYQKWHLAYFQVDEKNHEIIQNEFKKISNEQVLFVDAVRISNESVLEFESYAKSNLLAFDKHCNIALPEELLAVYEPCTEIKKLSTLLEQEPGLQSKLE
jgi:hypothetical protein